MNHFKNFAEWLNNFDPSRMIREMVVIEEWFQEKYQINQLLGYGHTCVVFEAIDVRLSRKVALKIWYDYSFGLNSDTLLSEARLLAHIHHPYIVSVYDYGYDKTTKRPWMALEHLGLETLLDFVEKENGLAYQWSLIVDVAWQIASIINFLQGAHNLVQLDIKPGNFSFDRNSKKITMMDLGSAYVKNNNLINLLGTPGYIAPEFFYNSPINNSADVYSLGMLLVKLIMGKNPLVQLQRKALEDSFSINIDSDVTAAIPIPPQRVKFTQLLEEIKELNLTNLLTPLNVPTNLLNLIVELTNFNSVKRPSLNRILKVLTDLQLPSQRLKKPTLFISHSHKDKQRFVTNFAETLKDKGFNVWLDEWNLRVGDPFWESIGAAMETCDFIVIVMSENSLSSSGMKEEIRTAHPLNIEKVKVLPIRIDPIDISLVPLHLRSRHILDFVGWEHPDIYYKKIDKLSADVWALYEISLSEKIK